MRAVSGALAAGYSIENAVGEGAKELEKMYGEQEKMAQEFNRIRTQLELKQTIEKLFYDLAEKSELESISDFAQVFAAAKRTGGNLSEIIQNTNEWILEKNETKREIRTCIAAKKSEQKIMSAVPVSYTHLDGYKRQYEYRTDSVDQTPWTDKSSEQGAFLWKIQRIAADEPTVCFCKSDG